MHLSKEGERTGRKELEWNGRLAINRVADCLLDDDWSARSKTNEVHEIQITERMKEADYICRNTTTGRHKRTPLAWLIEHG